MREGKRPLIHICYVMLEYIYDKFNCILCYVGYENIIKIKSGDITHVVAMNVIRNGYV